MRGSFSMMRIRMGKLAVPPCHIACPRHTIGHPLWHCRFGSLRPHANPDCLACVDTRPPRRVHYPHETLIGSLSHRHRSDVVRSLRPPPIRGLCSHGNTSRFASRHRSRRITGRDRDPPWQMASRGEHQSHEGRHHHHWRGDG